MAKKKALSIVSGANELVKAFSTNTEADFILNPISYTQIRGNFSLAQTSLMIGIVAQLQDRIKEALSIGDQLLLFKPEDLSGNLLTFEIPLKELGISPKKYGELEVACDALMHVDMSYKRLDEETNTEWLVKQNIFHKIEFPTSVLNADGEKVAYKSGQRRTGVIRIQMVDESAREILNLRKGYTRHLKGITALCRSPRTPRLYIYLSAWRRLGGCLVNYIDLKEFFGVLTFSKDHKRIVENKYQKYGAFHRDVLDPVQKEMQKLAEEGKVEFYFEYEPVYTHGATRGDPDNIRFVIKDGKPQAEEEASWFYGRLCCDLIVRYGLQYYEMDRLRPLLFPGLEIKEELEHIDRLLEQKKPDCVHAYVTTVLYNWLVKQQLLRDPSLTFEGAEEVKEEQQIEHPRVEAAMREKWNWFMERSRERLGEQFYHTFMETCSDLWMVRDKNIYVAVPSEYVKNKWEERISEISSYFFTAFGMDRVLCYVFVDLTQVGAE